ncbi:MAG: DUF5689 domain-containing protein [Rikenellaceae bacterium]
MNKFEEAPTEAQTTDSPFNITIEELHARTSAYDYYDITQDITISGSVTANDIGGNFYKSFVMEQGGYAVEVLEGITYSYIRFQEGYEVTVQLNGLRLARSGGVLQVGVATATGSYYDVDYMEHELMVDNHIVNTGNLSPIEPLTLSLEAVSGDEGSYTLKKLCGRLVTIEGLRYYDESQTTNIAKWSGEQSFINSDSLELRCYTNSYANYSECEIPMGELSITGILEYDDYDTDECPMIKMRYEADCVECN